MSFSDSIKSEAVHAEGSGGFAEVGVSADGRVLLSVTPGLSFSGNEASKLAGVLLRYSLVGGILNLPSIQDRKQD